MTSTTIYRKSGLLSILCILVTLSGLHAQNTNEKEEILHHGATIRQAFLDQDIDKIKSLHHPEVIKALGYNDLKVGREAVVKGLEETLANFNLKFIKNEVENILIEGSIAIEQTKFSIEGTPKEGGGSFVFSGRTVVTYIKDDTSATGWVTIREIIQPEVK